MRTLWPIIRDESRSLIRRADSWRLRDGNAVTRSALHGGVPQSWRMGRPFTSAWEQYPRMAGCGSSARDMPQETNRITIDSKAKDKFGLPVANVHYDDHPTTSPCAHRLQAGRAVYKAVGATVTYPTTPYPALTISAPRNDAKAKDGVVNKFGRPTTSGTYSSRRKPVHHWCRLHPTLRLSRLPFDRPTTSHSAMQRKEI